MDLFQLDDQARPWLNLLDSMESLDIKENLPIPQIAVFGDQSSGKSSLLESLSGIIFPKGSGLVTKCPTRISMSRCDKGSPWMAKLSFSDQVKDGDIDPSLSDVVHTPEELSRKLELAGDIVARSSSTSFSSAAINVLVQSPSTPNLTLIDLPGIIRTTTAGQDKAVIATVDALLDYYLRQTETVILAVIPANQDIATIDILERASKFDPSGSRTIGVLTKLDLVDKGAEHEILDVVMNVKKPLKLGYLVVKNRNQSQLNKSVSVEDGIRDEEEYFSSHDMWSNIEPKQKGIKSLCSKLTFVIVSRAHDRAPFLKWLLLDHMAKSEEKLSSLGNELPSSVEERRKILIRVISRFSQTLRQLSAGDYRDQLARNDTDLRIKYQVGEILQELKVELGNNVPDLDDEAYSKRLADTITSMRGRYARVKI